MNPKAILEMLGRKNVTVFAAALVSMWFAVHHPEQAKALIQPIDDFLAPLIKDYGGGLLGAIGLAYSVYLSTAKEKQDMVDKVVAKYQEPPETVDPRDAKVLAKAGVELPKP